MGLLVMGNAVCVHDAGNGDQAGGQGHGGCRATVQARRICRDAVQARRDCEFQVEPCAPCCLLQTNLALSKRCRPFAVHAAGAALTAGNTVTHQDPDPAPCAQLQVSRYHKYAGGLEALVVAPEPLTAL